MRQQTDRSGWTVSPAAEHIYGQIAWKRRVVLFCAAAAVLLMLLVDLSVGSSSLTLSDCVQLLFAGPAAGGNRALIFWQIRCPMTFTCIGVGGCLALAGLEVQTITNNPLSSPYTLGISSGAGLGAALSIVTGFTILGTQWAGTVLMAFAFALFVTGAIYLLGKQKGMSAQTLVLSGIVMNFFFTALQQYLQYRASAEVAQIISNWSFGNLSRASWTSAAASIFILATGALLLASQSWKLTALNAGEERAHSLGIRVQRLKRFAFLVSAMLIAGGVGFIGTVGFVGLVSPHIARLLAGEDQRYLMPVSVLSGIFVMLAASTVSKLLTEGSMLPVGIVTSIVGVPFLFILLMREMR